MAAPEMLALAAVGFLMFLEHFASSESTDIEIDVKVQTQHNIDSLNIVIYTCLLSLTVITIWVFKHRRLRFLHETGLAVIYGLFVGFFIRYTFVNTEVSHMTVNQDAKDTYNNSLPPDTLWLKFNRFNDTNKTVMYAYTFRGGVNKVIDSAFDLKATFDPEIFFNIILPPIIFHAGYSLKRKYFFRNLGAILTYAIIGTSISVLVVGILMYFALQMLPFSSGQYTFLDTLYFGALISPTDPLTILAIFHDMKADVTLYSIIFGESVLNDAVAIVLTGSIQKYGEHHTGNSGTFESKAFLLAVTDFIGIFSASLMIGTLMGCFTAIISLSAVHFIIYDIAYLNFHALNLI